MGVRNRLRERGRLEEIKQVQHTPLQVRDIKEESAGGKVKEQHWKNGGNWQ